MKQRLTWFAVVALGVSCSPRPAGLADAAAPMEVLEVEVDADYETAFRLATDVAVGMTWNVQETNDAVGLILVGTPQRFRVAGIDVKLIPDENRIGSDPPAAPAVPGWNDLMRISVSNVDSAKTRIAVESPWLGHKIAREEIEAYLAAVVEAASLATVTAAE